MVSRDRFDHLQDEVISNARFPEPVRVLRVDILGGSRFTLCAVGIDSQKYYERVLSRSEIDALTPQTSQQLVLAGDPSRFKLATEAYRIRLAHLYDPAVRRECVENRPAASSTRSRLRVYAAAACVTFHAGR